MAWNSSILSAILLFFVNYRPRSWSVHGLRGTDCLTRGTRVADLSAEYSSSAQNRALPVHLALWTLGALASCSIRGSKLMTQLPCARAQKQGAGSNCRSGVLGTSKKGDFSVSVKKRPSCLLIKSFERKSKNDRQGKLRGPRENFSVTSQARRNYTSS